HQHHRLVRGTVAVWVVLADHVADGARGLLGLGAGVEAELAHRVDDPPLHRLQAVADEGQGAVEDHVHRIVEVGALGVLAKRDLLEAVEVGTYGLGHAGSVTWIAVARVRARNQRIDRTRRVRVRPPGTGHSMRSPTCRPSRALPTGARIETLSRLPSISCGQTRVISCSAPVCSSTKR